MGELLAVDSDRRWPDFVVDGLGTRCVENHPWVTGAETCELVLSLDAVSEHARALELFASMQHLRDPDGSYWTGYQFANEYPTNQYQANDPALKATVIYPRGTVAMATSGPNTNESQFFLVFRDTEMPPESTVFGTIDEVGLATLDKVAKAGVAGNRESGMPASTVRIKSVQVG